MKNIALFTGVITAGFMLAIAPFTTPSVSAATEYTLSIPIKTVIRGDKGSNHVITEQSVDSGYVGYTCSISALSENQYSVHPNNDLTVSTGADSVVLADIEREGHVTTQAISDVTLGTDISVTLTLGEHEVFSGGMDVLATCAEPTVDVCRDGEVINISKSDQLSTDTAGACPEVKAETILNVCRDGKVVVVKESAKLDTDTEAPCEVATEKVCRDGETMTINSDDRKTTDADAPCPEVLGKATVKELPNTGPGAIIAGITGATFVGGTALAQLRMRRRQNY